MPWDLNFTAGPPYTVKAYHGGCVDVPVRYGPNYRRCERLRVKYVCFDLDQGSVYFGGHVVDTFKGGQGTYLWEPSLVGETLRTGTWFVHRLCFEESRVVACGVYRTCANLCAPVRLALDQDRRTCRRGRYGGG